MSNLFTVYFAADFLFAAGSEIGSQNDGRYIQIFGQHKFNHHAGIQFGAVEIKQSQVAFDQFRNQLVSNFTGRGVVLFDVLRKTAAVPVAGAFLDILRQKRIAGQVFVVE